MSKDAVDTQMRELHSQLMGARQMLDREIMERRTGDSDQGKA
jgi:hypothetical protein